MNFASRSSGIFMMSLSAGLLFASIISSIYYFAPYHTPGGAWTINGFEIGPDLAGRAHHPDGKTVYESTVSKPLDLATANRVFPYRWLTQPLLVIGLASFLTGLFLYRNELHGLF